MLRLRAALAVAVLALAAHWAVAQQTPAPAPTMMASAPAHSASTAATPPPIVYAPKRSFSQWVDDLPNDPTLLIGFIISLLSGAGFLFIVYSVFFELFMGIPLKRQSYLAGGGVADAKAYAQ